MKKYYLSFILVLLMAYSPISVDAQAPVNDYLQEIKSELKKEWPANRIINLVFHGHSVPAGYFKTPEVRTLDAYPQQVLEQLKSHYPTAVINVIATAIGGENSEKGAARFEAEVLVHRPDVLFIDYALNDRNIGLEKAKVATEDMIRKALKMNIKVILLTPSPDMRVNLTKPDNVLEQFAGQLLDLSKKYSIGLSDSYGIFKQQVEHGEKLDLYMSQVNHPNRNGHELIADEIMKYFALSK